MRNSECGMRNSGTVVSSEELGVRREELRVATDNVRKGIGSPKNFPKKFLIFPTHTYNICVIMGLYRRAYMPFRTYVRARARCAYT